MGSTESEDHAAEFTKELLRAGDILYGLATDLVEAVPQDAYPGEAPAEVVVEMMVGTIRTFLDGVDPGEVRRASDLMSGACDRLLEHLKLALELSRRVHRRGGGVRGPAYG